MLSAKWRPFCLGLNVLSQWKATPRQGLLQQANNALVT